ncbi:hypothetical protein Glove_16g153 [Diversispora epigaea]|uniref:Uncharacterized protein n=1 Tax=Diversispora epigaea TaxID=1348612 RepID=A0A397JPP4_9GLOM|nr:hypothetical protein Glove_16g153 [Diversispora epigaea]
MTFNISQKKELNELRNLLVYLAQDLWVTYANLEYIVQYCEDKIKDKHYQKLITELEQDMRGMVERLGMMVSIYDLKKKINYEPTSPEFNTNFIITEFIPRDIQYKGREPLSSHMKFQTLRNESHQKLCKKDFPEENKTCDKDDCNSIESSNSGSDPQKSQHRSVNSCQKKKKYGTAKIIKTVLISESDSSDSNSNSSTSNFKSEDKHVYKIVAVIHPK